MVLLDEESKVVHCKREKNELSQILYALKNCGGEVAGLAVESTYNWYWLVDGLMAAGYRMHLANPAAMQQYSGLKHSNDESDAWWLAKMLQLGVLPEGYIYPKETRPVRDLLRKRSQLVRQRTQHLLSLQNIVVRNTGQRLSGYDVLGMETEELTTLLRNEDLVLPLECSQAVGGGPHLLDHKQGLLRWSLLVCGFSCPEENPYPHGVLRWRPQGASGRGVRGETDNLCGTCGHL
jgi:hypothetical protein